MPRIYGFLDRFHRGDPVAKTARIRNLNRIANILEGIIGVGCHIEKPLNAEGDNWRIVVDGASDGGDAETPDGFIPPSRFPFGSEWSFGLGIDGATVTVYNPCAMIGGTQDMIVADDTDITMTAGNEYIGWQLDMTAAPYVLTVTGPHDAVPTSDVAGGLYRGALYRLTLVLDDDDNVTHARLMRDYVHGMLWPQVYT